MQAGPNSSGTWSGQNQYVPPTAGQLSDMISGWGVNGILGYGGLGVTAGGGLSGAYIGTGLMTPQFGIGGGYTWQLPNLPISW